MADPRLCSISGCGKPHSCKGFCKKHYTRFSKYGDPLFVQGTPMGLVQEFFEKTACTYEGDDCLIWPFSGTKGGYASFWYKGKTQSVNRLLCTQEHGPAPRKHHAAHSCGNGHLGCVNRHHLSWKTVKENSDDKISHGTIRKGQANGNSKLSEEEAREILLSKIPRKVLAKRYNVTETLIGNIKRRTTWRHLDQ